MYVDQLAGGVIEAKPAGTTLSGVEWQRAMYADGLPAEVRLKAVTTETTRSCKPRLRVGPWGVRGAPCV